MNRESKLRQPPNKSEFPMDRINEQVRRAFGQGAIISGGFDFISPLDSASFDVERTAEAHRSLLRLLDAKNNIDE